MICNGRNKIFIRKRLYYHDIVRVTGNGGDGMIRLNILKNMDGFLQAVNECDGPVNLLGPDGRKENMNQQYGIQNELLQKYKENKNYLRLSLDIPTTKDYMKIVFFSIGEC